MKQFKFQNKASIIRGIKEEKPKKKTNWDRIIYLLIFTILLASFFFYVIQRNISASANGEVITNRFDVKEAEDMKILQYYVQVGDTVRVGDTLFKYRTDFRDENDLGAAISVSTPAKTNDWIIREIALTKRNIQLNNIEINDLKTRVKKTEQEIERLKLEVYLDVYTPAVLKQQRMLLSDYKVQLEKKSQEQSQLYMYLRQMEELLAQQQQPAAQASIASNNVGGLESLYRYYISPVNGVISQINTPVNGITYKKDVTLYITNFDKIYIRTYIPQHHLQYFKLGDEVRLRFYDGTRGKGIIKDLYVNTDLVPDEFRSVRGEKERTVIAEIYPIDEKERQHWLPYYQFSVKVTRYKF
ncbi:MAG: HlyD family secretion protein [Bacteroidales bacterium]|jgi:hypothetical protein|nr:HlyD family secretion protein [Bacteroidales bacterium]NPV36830.1 HlyD family secretion protein [Bacteroidales bacterium]